MSPPTAVAIVARHVLADAAPPVRLDRAVVDAFHPQVWSRAAAKKLCKQGQIAVNGEVAEPSRWVGPGDALELLAHGRALPAVFELALEVAYEDAHLAVVVKPAGLPTSGNQHRTLAHALPFSLAPSDAVDALARPWPAHRLDAQTSGLVLVGKAAGALARLNAALEAREVTKRYRAVVRGRLEGEGVVDREVEGRPARTRWRSVDVTDARLCDAISAVDLWPETGRTHQLRQHLAALGHPIMGDKLYTEDGALLRGSGLYLAAVGVALTHPVTGEPLAVEIGPPDKFATLWRRTAAAWERSPAPA